MTRDKKILDLISKEPMSTREIGKILSIDRRTVLYYLDQHKDEVKKFRDLNGDTRKIRYGIST